MILEPKRGSGGSLNEETFMQHFLMALHIMETTFKADQWEGPPRIASLEIEYIEKKFGNATRLPQPFDIAKEDPFVKKMFDNAMTNNGGIDLNPARDVMEVRNGSPIKTTALAGSSTFGDDKLFNIDPAQVTGATFTIRTMTPVTDLPQILGLASET
jgi:hypothetical protein